MRLGYFAQVADMPETTRLYDTVVTWWNAIEVLIVTGAATGKVEAETTAIKQIKRTGRGFRYANNYRTHILLGSAAKPAGSTPGAAGSVTTKAPVRDEPLSYKRKGPGL